MNTLHGEELRMFKFFLVSPSSDCKSDLQCLNSAIPCSGNILLANHVSRADESAFDVLVMEDGVGYMNDTSRVYSTEYYQHEQSCILHSFSFIHSTSPCCYSSQSLHSFTWFGCCFVGPSFISSI